MTKHEKSLLSVIVFGILIFGIPYLWRQYRDNDIKDNSKYAFGKIIKRTGSLKNGKRWHYSFYYKDSLIQGRWPTHVNYDIRIGDYILVNFSSSDPEHNKPLYNYKLKQYKPEIVKQVWDTIPLLLTIDTQK
jgi:hypothetical protein